jgi:translation initiation factor IF-3
VGRPCGPTSRSHRRKRRLRHRRVDGFAGGRVPPACLYGPEEAPGRFVSGNSRTPQREADAIEKRIRINEQIRISPIRLIDENGGQVGIVALDEARRLAEERSLDLVEVAPEARPPVVRMMDYGKFKYEQARAARDAKKKQHTIQVKEVKFRPGIEDHDYEFKMRHARRFLEEGNKVKLTMMFRGRQVTHPELGLQVLERVAGDLQDVAKVEMHPSFEGRQMSMVLAPAKQK